MQYEREPPDYPDEVHRYFPEWADRPEAVDALLEAEHNSYLAGGYSEEFGYRVRADRPSVFPLLHGNPERTRLWCVQIGCLHPGYPECARPHDRDAMHCGLSSGWPLESDPARATHPSQRSGDASHRSAQAIHVIRVGERGRDLPHEPRLPTLLLAAWKRLTIRRSGH